MHSATDEVKARAAVESAEESFWALVNQRREVFQAAEMAAGPTLVEAVQARQLGEQARAMKPAIDQAKKAWDAAKERLAEIEAMVAAATISLIKSSTAIPS